MEQAIFLLAGQSSRFKGIVPHKSLLRLAGQTLLRRQIIQAASLGVRRFIFGLGAAEEDVAREIFVSLQHIPHDVVSIVINQEFAQTSNWATFWLCMQEAQPCHTMVLECDIVVEHLYLPRHHWSSSHWLVVGDYEGGGSFVLHDSEGVIVSQEYFADTSHFCCMNVKKSGGIFFLSPDDARGVCEDSIFSFDIVDEYMATRSPYIFTVPLPQWYELDTVEDFWQVHKVIEPVEYHPDPVLL